MPCRNEYYRIAHRKNKKLAVYSVNNVCDGYTELSKITGLGQVIGLVMVPVLFGLLAFCIKTNESGIFVLAVWDIC